MTHNDEKGLSYAILDGRAPQIIGGLTEIWMTSPELPGHDSTEDIGLRSERLEPPSNGTVFRFFQIPPQCSLAHLTREERLRIGGNLFERLTPLTCNPTQHATPACIRVARLTTSFFYPALFILSSTRRKSS